MPPVTTTVPMSRSAVELSGKATVSVSTPGDVQNGNMVRAAMWARLAAATDPAEPLYASLVRDWNRSERSLRKPATET